MNADHPLTRAQWIWPCHHSRVYNTYAHFRYDVDLAKVPRCAPLFVTADQHYMLYVNGAYVGRGPARGYQVSWPYDEHDVAALLRPGHNWIAVRCYAGGVSTYQYVCQGWPGLLCGAQWGDVTIATGSTWRMQLDTSHRRDVDPLSYQLGFQEQVDLRIDDQRWITSKRAPGQGWTDATGGVPFGRMPWHDLEPRGLPNLGKDVMPYKRTVAAGGGPCVEDYRDWRNVAWGMYDESRKWTWQTFDEPAVLRGASTVTLAPAGPGKVHAAALDMGRPVIGTLVLEARGALGGEVVDVYYSEDLDEDGLPRIVKPGQACMAGMATRLTLKKGVNRYETFQMIGHRFVTVVARETSSPLELTAACRHSVYPLEVTGSFECGDGTVNDIWRICRQTQEVCSLDAYVDTPWREQAQWWGDARVQAQNTFHLAGDSRLLARGIRSIAGQSAPNGLTYGHAPTCAHNCILPDFTLIWTITVWDHWFQTGSTELFVELADRIEWALSYFTGEGLGTNGLLRYDPRYWLFLDWTDIHKQGTPTLLNLWYVLALQKVRHLYELVGNAGRAKALDKLLKKHVRLVDRLLWDDDAGLYRDGLADDGTPVDVHSVHCQTVAMMAGLKPRKHRHMAESRLLPLLNGKDARGAVPSSYWRTYVFDEARRMGHGREVVEHLRREWAVMIPYEGCFETFTHAVGHGTCTHAWSAHPLFHLARCLGGIVQSGPAWSEVAFDPVTDVPGIDKVDLAIPTPKGRLRSRWITVDGRAEGEVQLPEGVVLRAADGKSYHGVYRWRD